MSPPGDYTLPSNQEIEELQKTIDTAKARMGTIKMQEIVQKRQAAAQYPAAAPASTQAHAATTSSTHPPTTPTKASVIDLTSSSPLAPSSKTKDGAKLPAVIREKRAEESRALTKRQAEEAAAMEAEAGGSSSSSSSSRRRLTMEFVQDNGLHLKVQRDRLVDKPWVALKAILDELILPPYLALWVKEDDILRVKYSIFNIDAKAFYSRLRATIQYEPTDGKGAAWARACKRCKKLKIPCRVDIKRKSAYSCANCYKSHDGCGAQIFSRTNLTDDMECFLYAEVGNHNPDETFFDADEWAVYEKTFRKEYPHLAVIKGEKEREPVAAAAATTKVAAGSSSSLSVPSSSRAVGSSSRLVASSSGTPFVPTRHRPIDPSIVYCRPLDYDSEDLEYEKDAEEAILLTLRTIRMNRDNDKAEARAAQRRKRAAANVEDNDDDLEQGKTRKRRS